MKILTPEEKQLLDVFLHEATTAPFTGPATQALHKIGVEYRDISDLAWAYEQDVPRTSLNGGIRLTSYRRCLGRVESLCCDAIRNSTPLRTKTKARAYVQRPLSASLSQPSGSGRKIRFLLLF